MAVLHANESDKYLFDYLAYLPEILDVSGGKHELVFLRRTGGLMRI